MERESLPEARSCVKCGEASDLFIRWHGAGSYHKTREQAPCCSNYGERSGEPKGEHLHVVCRTCGFDWAEDTLDNLGAAA